MCTTCRGFQYFFCFESQKALHDLQNCKLHLYQKNQSRIIKTIKTSTPFYSAYGKKCSAPLTVKKIILYCDNNWLLHVKKISCEQKNKWLGLHWQSKVQKIKSISIFMHTIYCTSIHNVPYT